MHAPTGPDAAATAARSTPSLTALAEEFSPRYQSHRPDLVVVDIRGLERLLGHPQRIGEEIRRSAMRHGRRVQVGIATTRTTALVLALSRPGLTVVPPGKEAEAIAPLAIGILDRLFEAPSADASTRDRQSGMADAADSPVPVFKQWGLRTLGELASLPPGELSARLGRRGLVWQLIARGQDVGPLVPTVAGERFESSIELEWPIEGLEPLSFVLTRLLEPLSTRLERRDRGAAAIHVTLGLLPIADVQHRLPVERGQPGDRTRHGSSETAGIVDSGADTYTRSLQLPSPIRDVRALRTLLLLDLESHPPAAPIERVTVTIDPTPSRVLQHTLYVRAHPTPEQLSTLVARLHALMGEDRVGCPVCVETFRPGAVAMQPFATEHDPGDGPSQRETHSVPPGSRARSGHRRTGSIDQELGTGPSPGRAAAEDPPVVSALRRCRVPVPARVAIAGDRPSAVTTDRRGFAGGRVLACAGPWRSSGDWWRSDGEKGDEEKGDGVKGDGVKSDVRACGATAGAARPHTLAARASTRGWNRDEWDVSLSDGAVYRIFQDRDTGRWFIDAIVD
jgi:protein ImuB